MARGSTVVGCQIELSDVDRGVYESLDLKAAQHPSETTAYLVTRILAYVLEYREGIAFSEGLSSGEQPPIWVHDLTGQLTAWIDVGTPTAARLHKASKAADAVTVYCHQPHGPWLDNLAQERVHRADALALCSFEPAHIQALADALQRRNTWSVTRMEDTVYVEVGNTQHTLPLTRHTLA